MRAEEGRTARVGGLTVSGCDHLEVLEHNFMLQDCSSDQLTKPSRHDQSLVGYTNNQHVETDITARRRAGGPFTCAALLHGRCGPEVLLRGIAEGHLGRWYGTRLPLNSGFQSILERL
jgi:hypothetical protein